MRAANGCLRPFLRCVQTTGRISAQQALRRALSDLKDLCVEVKEQYVGATEEADRNMQTD